MRIFFRVGVAVLLAFTSARIAHADPLDAEGRAMLDPIRVEALEPDEAIARLHLRRDAVVADVGAGPGFWTVRLARAVPRGRVIATDVKRAYLDEAVRRARAAGLMNVETRVVEGERAGLRARSVDLVWMCQVDHYLGDRAGYFAQLVTALRRGGRIVLVNYARYREADLEAARKVGLRVVDSWAPSPPFFVLVLEPSARR